MKIEITEFFDGYLLEMTNNEGIKYKGKNSDVVSDITNMIKTELNKYHDELRKELLIKNNLYESSI